MENTTRKSFLNSFYEYKSVQKNVIEEKVQRLQLQILRSSVKIKRFSKYCRSCRATNYNILDHVVSIHSQTMFVSCAILDSGNERQNISKVKISNKKVLVGGSDIRQTSSIHNSVSPGWHKVQTVIT